MNHAIIRFRLRQIWKIIKEIPIPYLLLITGLLAFGMVFLSRMMQDVQQASVVGGIWLLFLWGLHAGRRDFHFIELVEASPWRIFFLEYLLLSLPVIVLEVACGWFVVVLAIMLACLIFALKKQGFRRVKNGLSVPQFIPVEAFELRAGIRRQGLVFLILYIGALAAVGISYLSLAFVWLMLCVLTEAFKMSEPLSLVCVQELPDGKFLWRKIGLNTSLPTVALLPVYLIYLAFHPEDWLFVGLFFLYGVLNTMLIIVTKYAYYRPDAKVMAGQIAFFISMFGMVFPVLFPVTVFYLIKYYWAARRNLKTYLYVYN